MKESMSKRKKTDIVSRIKIMDENSLAKRLQIIYG